MVSLFFLLFFSFPPPSFFLLSLSFFLLPSSFLLPPSSSSLLLPPLTQHGHGQVASGAVWVGGQHSAGEQGRPGQELLRQEGLQGEHPPGLHAERAPSSLLPPPSSLPPPPSSLPPPPSSLRAGRERLGGKKVSIFIKIPFKE